MTTEELIKALREKPSRDNRKFLDDVADYVEMLQNAIFALNEELIARKAEVEEQETKIEQLKTAMFKCGEERVTARAEAVKEFAERLKEKIRDVAKIEFQDGYYYLIGVPLIDNLVKEFTEGG